MATQTPVAPPAQVDLDRSTQPLDPTLEPLQDPLSYLDHRHRRRTMPAMYAPPGHYLELRDGSEQRLLPVHERIAHVGRSLASELRFEESHVSRRHAILVRYGNHVRLLDDRSSGGTFVNGYRIVATDLQDGDVIRLGRIMLRYVRLV